MPSSPVPLANSQLPVPPSIQLCQSLHPFPFFPLPPTNITTTATTPPCIETSQQTRNFFGYPPPPSHDLFASPYPSPPAHVNHSAIRICRDRQSAIIKIIPSCRVHRASTPTAWLLPFPAISCARAQSAVGLCSPHQETTNGSSPTKNTACPAIFPGRLLSRHLVIPAVLQHSSAASDQTELPQQAQTDFLSEATSHPS